jgi:hypothetical protein
VKLMYELWYRWRTPPWSGAPREELMNFVEAGRLQLGGATTSAVASATTGSSSHNTVLMQLA